MSARTKEEELALDEKIARIQRKNEEILRRQKEIEEDKRLAEQQNAIVKLRPSTTNISRERTPALKPSNRELRHDITEEISEAPPLQRSYRGSFRGRGGERSRGQGDRKVGGGDGPPPDPRSFLYDDERDGPVKDDIIDQKRELERGWRDERDSSDSFRGGSREFQRGRRRGGIEYRGERGRRGGGRRRNEEEEWRAERMKIDEARIQRQRAADGKWRREWDSDKVLQEPVEETRNEKVKFHTPIQEKWSPPIHCHGQFHISPDRHSRHSSRGIPSRGGRGRGRLDPAELEMPLEKYQVEILKDQTSAIQKISPVRDSELRHPSSNEVASHSSPEGFKLDVTRSLACVGNSVKISIPNMGIAQSNPKPQRQPHEGRGRFKSQTSYSSQSDDDTPRDRGHRDRGRRQRNLKTTKSRDKVQYKDKNSEVDQTLTSIDVEMLPVQNKPPLPPFRAEPKSSAELKEPVIMKDGDESWEDVTTSGTESMGEDLSSVHYSPLRRTIGNSLVISGGESEPPSSTLSINSLKFPNSNQIFDENVKISDTDYLKEFGINEVEKNSFRESMSEFEPLKEGMSDTSSINISLDTSNNLLNEIVSEELDDEGGAYPATAILNTVKRIVPEENVDKIPEEEIISRGVETLNLVEDKQSFVLSVKDPLKVLEDDINNTEFSNLEIMPSFEELSKSKETCEAVLSKEPEEFTIVNNTADDTESDRVVHENIECKENQISSHTNCEPITCEATGVIKESKELYHANDELQLMKDTCTEEKKSNEKP